MTNKLSSTTPGPWELELDRDLGWNWVFGQTKGASGQKSKGQIAVVGTPENEESVSNARLIAAAPDLLEALEAMFGAYYIPENHGPNPRGALGKAKQAIAKAKGE